MPLRPRSIRAKLLAVFVAATVVPMGLLGIIFYISSTHAVAEMAGNRTARIAQSVRSELDRRLELRVHDRLLATNQPVQAFLTQVGSGVPARNATTLAPLREYLARIFLQYGDHYDELVLADARGEPLLRYERTGSSLVRGEIPAAPGVRSPVRGPVADASRPDNLPSPAAIQAIGEGFGDADRLLFQAGSSLGPHDCRLHVAPIEAGSAPAVSALMPVQSNERPAVRLGYVLARIRAQHLWPPDWAGRRFGEQGELVVVSKVGEQVLYHTRRDWIGRQLNEVDRDLSEVAGPVSSKGPEVWTWAGGVNGRRVVTSLDATMAPWKIVVAAYPGEFVTEARRAALVNLVIATLALVLAASVLVVASGRVSRSIKRVTEGAQRIAGGDLLGPPIEAETHDEIESLAGAFNVMTASLRSNIAMREQTAAELDALNRSLESRVHERTRELETLNEALNRANEDLKELDRLKSNFLATVSHEFKTPLTSIKAFAEILYDELDAQGASDEVKRFLRIIDAESDRLARLIKNVLDLSRIESGRMAWRMTDFPMTVVVESAIDGLLPALRDKRIRVERELACGEARVHGDQDRIQEVLYNVLDNAIKASAEGQRIVIGCHEVAESANGPSPRMLRISVRDEGEGIPADQLERIFDRFHQVGSHSKRRRSGTGLGLAISREITEYHGGRIWAESSSGQGSTFHIDIPREPAVALRAAPSEGTPHPTNPTPEVPPHA